MKGLSPFVQRAGLCGAAMGFFLAISLAGSLAQNVGTAGRRLDEFLPGPELVVAPLRTGKDPLDLRILAVYPHGTAGFRYDLEYIGYVPGRLNLSAWLVPKDGARPVALPPVEVEISSALAPGKPGSLEGAAFRPAGIGSGYAIVFPLFVLVWLAAGIALLLGWFKSRRPKPLSVAAPPLSPAEQLRPWILRAQNGGLDASGKAELERRIMGFWRNRLGLTASPAEALRQIREDEEAGRLLRLVEDWLHNPAAAVSEAEINRALEPYGRPAP